MRWLSTLSISVVLVVAAVGSYYVYYVENRMSNQHEEKFRTMGSIATVFEGRLQSLSTVIRNTPYLEYPDLPAFALCASGSKCFPAGWYEQHTDIEHTKKYYKNAYLKEALRSSFAKLPEENSIENLISDDDCIRQEQLGYDLLQLIPANSDGTDDVSKFKQYLLQQLGSESKRVQLGREADDVECTARASVKHRLEVLRTYTLETFLSSKQSNQSGTSIAHALDGDNDLLATTVYPARADHQVRGAPVYYEIKVRTSFSKLLPEDIDPEVAFDKILLLDQNQEVLYSSGSPLPRMSAVKSLFTRTLENGEVKLQEVSDYSAVHKVELGNKSYYAYVHPLQVDLRVATDDSSSGPPSGRRSLIRWSVVGLLDESSFRRSTLNVTALPLIVFASFLILALLLAPFIKVLLLGPSDKITTQDMRNFGLMGVAALGILTIFLFSMWSHWQLTEHFSQQLHSIADRFDRKLEGQIDSRYSEVRKLGAERFQQLDPSADSRVYPPINQEDYPGIKSLAFINKTGMQKYKFRTVDEKPTPYINVASRKYFTGPSAAFESANEPPDCKNAYKLESIRSKNTGSKFSMLGLHGACLGTQGSTNYIMSARVDIGILDSQYKLPLGMSYAIVDDGGLVLYHSQPSKILEENIFSEVDESATLLAIMSADTPSQGQQVITYHGHPYRVHHKKLEYIDAHLLILQDLSLLDSISLQISGSSVLVFTLYMLIIVGIMLMSILSYGNESATWYWPNPAMRPAYFAVAAILVPYTVWTYYSLLILKGQPGILLLLLQAIFLSSFLVRYFETGVGRGYDRVRFIARLFQHLAVGGLVLISCYLLFSYFTDGGRAVIANSSTAFSFGLFFVLSLVTAAYFWLRRQSLFQSDGWLISLLPGGLQALFHPVYRSRIAFYSLITLVVLNLAVIPAVSIFRDARDAALLVLLEMYRIDEGKPGHRIDGEASRVFEIEDFKIAPTTSAADAGGSELRIHSLPAFFNRLSYFTVSSSWQQQQLTAISSLSNLASRSKDKEAVAGAKNAALTVMVENCCQVDSSQGIFYRLPQKYFGDPGAFLLPQVADSSGATQSDALTVGTEFEGAALMAVTVAALFYLFVMSLRWLCRGALGMYSRNQLPISTWDYRETNRSCLWLHPDEEGLDFLDSIPPGNRLDISNYANPGRLPAFSPEIDDAPILITHFEVCLLDPVVANQVLNALELQLYEFGRQLIIRSKVDPLPRFSDNSAHKSNRWLSLLSHFDLVQGLPGLSPAFAAKVDSLPVPRYLANILKSELGWSAELHRHLAPYQDRLLGMLEVQCLRLLANPQKSFCINLWNLSTAAQKRVLFQLASGDLVNPKQWDTVLELEARGLIVRDPGLRLVSHGMKRAIMETVTKQESKLLARPDEISPWSVVKLPLAVMLGLAALFLFVTQRDLFDMSAGAAMGAVVALPAIARVFTLLAGDASSSRASTTA